MVFIKLLLLITCSQRIVSFDLSPDKPVPHAELLDEFLRHTYFKNYSESNTVSVFDYLFGGNFTDLENEQISDHLDVSVLSPNNINKIVEDAKRKYLLEMHNETDNETFQENLRKNYIFNGGPLLRHKVINWMKQSIYGTRRRLEVTRPFRKKYHRDISYNIGVLCGILIEMMPKLESLLASMTKLQYEVKYMWSVFIYQRIISFHVDISYVVHRIFEFQKKWNIFIGRTIKGEEPPEESAAHVDNDNVPILDADTISQIEASMKQDQEENVDAQAPPPMPPGEPPAPPIQTQPKGYNANGPSPPDPGVPGGFDAYGK